MEEEVPNTVSLTSDDRLWALLSHLAYFFFTIFGPLIIWVVKKDDSLGIDLPGDLISSAINQVVVGC